jgi:TonB-linked SusC/RagA family outer membrane protein
VQIASTSGTASSNGGMATQAQTEQTDAFFENTLTWDKQFNSNNRLNLLGGTSWQQSKYNSFSASGQGFPDDHFLNGLSSAAIAMPPTNSNGQNSLLSFYIRANYAFKEKYLLTFTGRSDASSKFPKDNRVGYFPSGGAAWRINEEKFLKKATWINELKLRVSAGYTGTQNLGDNMFYTLYTPRSYAGTNALIPTQLGNDHIKWETTLQKDLGLDFAFFNSRLRGTVGYYSKHTTDLLLSTPVASSSGYTTVTNNLADITNKGLEIDLRGDIIRTRNFTWTGALNISANRSKVDKIHKDFSDPSTYTDYGNDFINSIYLNNTIVREGEPLGLIYGYQFDGLIRTQKDLDDYKANSIYAKYGIIPYLGIGDAKYKLVDTGLYKGYFATNVIGHAQPKFFGGFTNTFTYKNISLIGLLTYSYGGDLLYLSDAQNMGLGNRANKGDAILDHYSASNPNSNRPRLLLGQSGATGTSPSSMNVYDASFIKLKSITINYMFPRKLMEKWGMREVNVYASATNLFTITSYPGADPEVSNNPYSIISGYSDAGGYPTTKQFNVGMRIGF